MYIGKVVGTVIATRKDQSLVGAKLLITQPLNLKMESLGAAKVMVDTVGAGTGELVMCASGMAARNAAGNVDAAIDAAVVGIIDSLEVDADWVEGQVSFMEGEEALE